MINSTAAKVTKKFLNSAVYNTVVPSAAGSLVQPTLPAQGIQNGQREGDSLYIDAIQARIVIQNNASTTSSASASDACRIICLQARAATILTVSSTAAPTTGVLDLGTGGASTDLTSFVNFNAKNEIFHVLYDKVHSCSFLSSTAFQEINLELKPRVPTVNFTPTTTTSQCGGIFLDCTNW